VVGIGHQVFQDANEAVQTLVSKGLRATLQSGNLLTGEMLVSFEVVPNAPAATMTMQDGAFVFPTTKSDGFSSLEASAGDLLRQVNAIPFASIGQSLNDLTKNVSELTNGPQLQQALTGLAGTMSEAQSVLKKLDTDIGPVLKQLPEIYPAQVRTRKSLGEMTRKLSVT
jgi:paraquat-inducible protein B